MVSGKTELKLIVMVPNQNGFRAFSGAYLDDFAILTKLAEMVMLLICIWEMLGSNLGQDTDCPDDLNGFPQSIQANDCIIPQFRP
jgi:hypothetical protein